MAISKAKKPAVKKTDGNSAAKGSRRKAPVSARSGARRQATKNTPAKKVAAKKKAVKKTAVNKETVRKKVVKKKVVRKKAAIKKQAVKKTSVEVESIDAAETIEVMPQPVNPITVEDSEDISEEKIAEMMSEQTNLNEEKGENMSETSTETNPAEGLEGRFLLPRRLELSGIEEVYEELKSSLKGVYKKYVLDGADVAIIDTAGVQLLVALINHLTKQGCEVSWDNYSVQVYQMADELDLVDALGD